LINAYIEKMMFACVIFFSSFNSKSNKDDGVYSDKKQTLNGLLIAIFDTVSDIDE
jgi:hypothetical protein